MSDKTNTWKIALGLLGTTATCTLTLLAGAHPAQGAPPARNGDPTVTEARLQHSPWTESLASGSSKLDLSGSVSVLGPDSGNVANSLPDIIKPKPKEPPSWWWHEPESAAFGTGIDLPGGVDIGTLGEWA